ncbi:MAG: hypothetical protein R3D27_13130 [Hyphomicrobiaceae bacterium]
MAVTKYVLFGVATFLVGGAAMLPGITAPTPERDLAMGMSYFSRQCSSLTRNRQINGNFGRGDAYCACLTDTLATSIRTGDEYRFAEGIHEAVGAERWVAQKARMRAAIDRVKASFENRVSTPRMGEVLREVIANARHCAQSV